VIVEIYRDHGISGGKGREKRPAFDKLHRDATLRKFDLVMAWSVDRLGRSLQDLVHFLDHLRSTRVELFLHQQGLDTTSPAGRAMFGMLSVFSEFERAIIQERIAAGMARAKAKGTKSGSRLAVPGLRRQSRIGSAWHIALAGLVCAIWLRSSVWGGRLCAVSCVAATETH
jgi:DNA invertase Pin-like site-specific DNA recombinase